MTIIIKYLFYMFYKLQSIFNKEYEDVSSYSFYREYIFGSLYYF